MSDYASLSTEKQNSNSSQIDKMTAAEIVTLINNEDKGVAFAVEKVLPDIAKATELISDRLREGGRLIYVGAGTSGRLGILDAAECPPTFGVSPELVVGVIAGGRDAVFRSAEGVEDDGDAAVSDLKALKLREKDVCFGISASGSAQYVRSALVYASSMGALTVALSCNAGNALSCVAQVSITPQVGAEVIIGSTRMKSGTAEKMVLNMISTGVMVLLGRVQGNRMIYMRASNKKLVSRACRIICESTGVTEDNAAAALSEADGDINIAIDIINKRS